MKTLNIREAEITKEMYSRAKEIENLWNKTKNLDCRTEEFKKLNNKWIKMSNKFEEEVCDDFDTLEIVNEYERRERNADRLLSQDQNVYEITYIDDTTREFKFFACSFDKETKKLYMLNNNIWGNPFPAVTESPKIKKVECVERNNNLDFQ